MIRRCCLKWQTVGAVRGKAAFDDSLWTQGPGPHGQGLAGMGTTVSGVVGNTPSLYAHRLNASAADAADAKSLQLLVDYDDSFVAYINGVEVARANLQNPNTFVPHCGRYDGAQLRRGHPRLSSVQQKCAGSRCQRAGDSNTQRIHWRFGHRGLCVTCGSVQPDAAGRQQFPLVAVQGWYD